MNDIDKEIAATEAKLAELKERKELAKITPEEIRIAELLHKHGCKFNHTDACDWYYGDWTTANYARNVYLKKARKCLEDGYTITSIEDIIIKYQKLMEI